MGYPLGQAYPLPTPDTVQGRSFLSTNSNPAPGVSWSISRRALFLAFAPAAPSASSQETVCSPPWNLQKGQGPLSHQELTTPARVLHIFFPIFSGRTPRIIPFTKTLGAIREPGLFIKSKSTQHAVLGASSSGHPRGYSRQVPGGAGKRPHRTSGWARVLRETGTALARRHPHPGLREEDSEYTRRSFFRKGVTGAHSCQAPGEATGRPREHSRPGPAHGPGGTGRVRTKVTVREVGVCRRAAETGSPVLIKWLGRASWSSDTEGGHWGSRSVDYRIHILSGGNQRVQMLQKEPERPWVVCLRKNGASVLPQWP